MLMLDPLLYRVFVPSYKKFFLLCVKRQALETESLPLLEIYDFFIKNWIEIFNLVHSVWREIFEKVDEKELYMYE